MQAKLGADIVDVPYSAFGFVKDGRLIGGAYYHSHHAGRDITISVVLEPDIAADPVAFRTAIRQVLSFPFGDLSLKRVTAEIDLANAESVRLAERVGFVREGVKRFAGAGGGDVGVFGLYRDGCQYWNAT